jgi:DNA-binding CsgD family transcriptional regulator
VEQHQDPRTLLADARAAHAHRDFRTAYRLMRAAGGADLLRSDDLLLLADAAWWLGEISQVMALSEALHHRFLDEGSIDRAALRAVDLAGMWFMRGEPALAMGWLSRGRRLLAGQPPGHAHAVIGYLEVSDALAGQRLDEATAGARDLQRLGATLGDDTFTALGVLGEGLAEIGRGHLEPGFGLLDEAMLPVVADRVAPEWAGNIYCTIVSTCIGLADLPRAREWTRATEKWLERFSDAVMFQGVCRAHRVELYTAEGSWREAEREAALVVADLADMNVAAVAEVEYQLGEAFRVRGMLERASVHHARAADLGRDPQPGAALLQLAAGDGESAWHAVTEALAGAGPDPFACARLLRAQVQIGLATGHLESAASAAGRLLEIRQRFATPGFQAWADEASGAALLAQGDPAAAVEPLSRASDGHRRLGARLDAARVDQLLAVAHGALGDEAAARAKDDAAEAVLHHLGVPVASSTQSRRALPGGLTPREVEVLTRIATGATNREAAADLQISEATVRRHLANVYTKLDVGSRTAAAAWAHEQGLVGRTRA